MDRINDLESAVDRLTRYQSGMYLTTSEHNCIAAVTAKIEPVNRFENGLNTSGLASVLEFRGSSSSSSSGGAWFATGQKITVRNIFDRPLQKSERFTFSKDKNGVWYPCVPLGGGLVHVGDPGPCGLEQTMIGKTDADGVPAAYDETSPGVGYVFGYYYDFETRHLEPKSPNQSGANNIRVLNSTPNNIGADKFVQCKLINGVWFVDVEPC